MTCVGGDARRMDALADDSVALVVTSPPYFAGKQYEEELDREGVPGSYIEYLELLRDVFSECKRVLEPGGRIAVNVANLGRKPYRSLAADVMTILQDDLRMLPRGEIVWQKGEGASGSCTCGSFRSAANPVLRDVTERIVVASKGRFGRARSPKERRRGPAPREQHAADDFMALTLDVWEFPPESGAGPPPCPLPCGAATAPDGALHVSRRSGARPVLRIRVDAGGGRAVRAARTVGYDLDPAYVELARARLDAEGGIRRRGGRERRRRRRWGDRQGVVSGDGASATALARSALESAGFSDVRANRRVRGPGLVVDFTGVDHSGRTWYFDVAGPNSAYRGGMARSEDMSARPRSSARAGRPRDRTLRDPDHPGAPAGHRSRPGPACSGAGRGLRRRRPPLPRRSGPGWPLTQRGRGRSPRPGFWSEADVAPGGV